MPLLEFLVLVLLAAVSGCGDNEGRLAYSWDDRRVLCSQPVDDLNGSANWDQIAHELEMAAHYQWAVMFHAHKPGVTVTTDTIERLLTEAERHGLSFVTFRELVPGAPRGALAFAFDDNAPDQWITVRDLLMAHGARVTFFVARYALLSTAEQDELRVLASDGHDLQPHSVNHLDAPDYVAAHGLDAYLNDEVLPSFDALTDAGYPPTTFAYPFGDHTDEIDDAVLGHVDKVRTTLGQCPW